MIFCLLNKQCWNLALDKKQIEKIVKDLLNNHGQPVRFEDLQIERIAGKELVPCKLIAESVNTQDGIHGALTLTVKWQFKDAPLEHTQTVAFGWD